MNRQTRSAIAELLSILGRPRRRADDNTPAESAETLLELAVDKLLATGQRDLAADLYTRHYASVASWREHGGAGDDCQSSYAAVGQYTREAARGQERALPIPRSYHKPVAPYLAPVSAAQVLGPSARQLTARAEFVRLYAKTQYADNAERQRAYRDRKRTTAKA